MKWFVTASLASCGGTMVSTIGLLALTSFYIYDKNTNVPCEKTEQWYTNIIALVPLSVIFAIGAVVSTFIVLSKKMKGPFIVLLAWTILCFGTLIYFVADFEVILSQDEVDPEVLFNTTNEAIHSSSEKNFIPEWLDNIQTKSKKCCGIRHFRDWETLWSPSEVPKSCCIDQKGNCTTNIDNLPWPYTASDYIKTNTGCMDEINRHVRKNIFDIWIFSMVILILYAFMTLFFVFQFCVQYGYLDEDTFTFVKKTPLRVRTEIKDEEADLDDINGSSPAESWVGSASGYTTSQGSLRDSPEAKVVEESPPPFLITPKNEGPSDAIVSSGSDSELPLAKSDSGKKKKWGKKKKKKPDVDDAVGTDDEKVDREEVVIVPDSMDRRDYALKGKGSNQNDLARSILAQRNNYSSSPQDNKGPSNKPTPSMSQDEVGDKVAPGTGRRGIFGQLASFVNNGNNGNKEEQPPKPRDSGTKKFRK